MFEVNKKIPICGEITRYPVMYILFSKQTLNFYIIFFIKISLLRSKKSYITNEYKKKTLGLFDLKMHHTRNLLALGHGGL